MFPTDPGRLPLRSREILALAYELTEDQVGEDAAFVRRWEGSDPHLIAAIEQRHGWSPESELGRYFLAALRGALE